MYSSAYVWAKVLSYLEERLGSVIISACFDDAEVIELTAQLMLLIAIYQFSDSIQGLSISMLRGLQDVKVIMPIVLCSYLLLNIPVGVVLAYHFDLECSGLVMGLIVGLSSAALLTALRIRRNIRISAV